jgi:hypothetical protein
VVYRCYELLTKYFSSRLSPYVGKIIGDHQCGFRHNRSTTDQIFCIHQILEKKWKYNETVAQLFIGVKKTYDSVRREILYNIFIEFGVHMKVIRLIKMCLNVAYIKVRIGKQLSDNVPIQNGLKQGNDLLPLFFNFALEYAIRKVQEHHVRMQLNGTHQLLLYADDNIGIIKKHREILTDARKKVDLDVNSEKTICCCLITRMQGKRP